MKPEQLGFPLCIPCCLRFSSTSPAQALSGAERPGPPRERSRRGRKRRQILSLTASGWIREADLGADFVHIWGRSWWILGADLGADLGRTCVGLRADFMDSGADSVDLGVDLMYLGADLVDLGADLGADLGRICVGLGADLMDLGADSVDLGADFMDLGDLELCGICGYFTQFCGIFTDFAEFCGGRKLQR